MSLRGFRFHPSAREEFDAAAEWYDAQRVLEDDAGMIAAVYLANGGDKKEVTAELEKRELALATDDHIPSPLAMSGPACPST